MYRCRSLLRYAASLAAIAFIVTGCVVGDGGQSAFEGPSMATSPARQLAAVDARGVQPCSKLVTAGTEASGERLPTLSLPCLTGGPAVNLSELGGRPVVINLWATWCGPCREEMPVLQAAHRRYGDGVNFLGVVTKDDPGRAGAFLEEVGVTYPQVVDVDGQLLAHLRTPGLPVTIVLDRAGRVANRHIGPLTQDALRDLVDA